ncbi:unnamed protein product [Caenorhabditis sp. 36 PRJEB53466]|nr:unnamed protein product [Caenorhabditis sp. 36 PRJEB53466]
MLKSMDSRQSKEESTSPPILSVPPKKPKYGRPKKTPAFSSFRCYEERDIEFFIHQVSDNDHIWDRKNSLNFDGNFIHATFDKIETCCQFLSRKNGENAARLWTELASEYKREKVRIENLPSGIYSEEFEIRFPFMQQMWFLEIDVKNSELKEADSNSLEETICGFVNKKSSIVEAPLTSSLSGPMEHLTDSINRLIGVIDRSSDERSGHPKHSDLIDHLISFFDKIPREKHLEYKCQIVRFLETLHVE